VPFPALEAHPVDTRIIDGLALSRSIRVALRERAARLAARGVQPGLAMIIVGDNPASKVYVRNKVMACDDVGVRSLHIELPDATTEAALLGRIAALNADPAVHGILVQLPLPKHIPGASVLAAISPDKDADGFHPMNVGLLVTGHPRFVPCTPAGVMAMLEAEGVNPWGSHAVVVGQSNIVGKPVAHLLLQKGATVTICNSKTRDLGSHTRRADILVAAAGKPKLITGDMVKPGAVVIDVGINRMPDGKLAGDCDFQNLLGVAARLTPVPGGVGPVTVTMLLANTIRAAELATGERDTQ
jgi:methylenetetrahydrofolate dehydrogenase (NADP+)/methenyltetrahydrofolate cyclohydrolase